jgi:phosphonate transport system substrate-binding protein
MSIKILKLRSKMVVDHTRSTVSLIKMKLNLVSYLVPDFLWFYAAVGKYLSRVLGIETQLSQGEFDSLEDPMLLEDQLDIAFICGLPFIRYSQINPGQLKAIAAPIMQASRYQNRPVYFADIIVNTQSNFWNLKDLAGKPFCYNDRGSNSGYHLLRHRLFQSGYPQGFFGNLIESGFHQRSMRLVASGIADCAAIDSVVLEQELLNFPELSSHLRVIESIGPRPMPPIVVAQHLGSDLIGLIQSALLTPDQDLQLAMKKARIQRYVSVATEDYAELGLMFEQLGKAGYDLINLP